MLMPDNFKAIRTEIKVLTVSTLESSIVEVKLFVVSALYIESLPRDPTMLSQPSHRQSYLGMGAELDHTVVLAPNLPLVSGGSSFSMVTSSLSEKES